MATRPFLGRGGGPFNQNSHGRIPVTSYKEDVSCLGIQNGQPLNIRRRPPTQSAAAFSPASFVKSASPHALAVAILLPTLASGPPFWLPRGRTSPAKTL